MPSTHVSLHYHVVWSTKDRRPSIDSAWRERLQAWLGGSIRDQEGVPVAIGGIADHVHALMGLKATHRLSDVMRMIKSESSEWVHREATGAGFAWQEGYGAFTVSPQNLDSVRHYILNQEEHHRKSTFQEEYLDLLKRSGTHFDERYVW
jgi:putative transposase